MKPMLWFVVLSVSAAGNSLTAQTGPKADPWEGLRFLVGAWEARTSGGNAQAKGTGAYSFRMELKDHVLVRHSGYETCKGPEDFNCEHGDLLYIYPEGPTGALRAIYFDNEGHVIHYAVTVPRPGAVVLLSDPDRPGPQFRLSYELNGGEMAGKFQMKLPGQSDFTSYLEWNGRRRE